MGKAEESSVPAGGPAYTSLYVFCWLSRWRPVGLALRCLCETLLLFRRTVTCAHKNLTQMGERLSERVSERVNERVNE